MEHTRVAAVMAGESWDHSYDCCIDFRANELSFVQTVELSRWCSEYLVYLSSRWALGMMVLFYEAPLPSWLVLCEPVGRYASMVSAVFSIQGLVHCFTACSFDTQAWYVCVRVAALQELAVWTQCSAHVRNTFVAWMVLALWWSGDGNLTLYRLV